jgi:tyrosyl-tRNA synthetase
MSKSWGNAIWLDDSPDEMYGKVMSLRDDLIMNYFTLATSLDLSEIDKIARELEQGANPMEYKKQLARELVTELHSQSAANQAEATWSQTFQQKEVAEAIVTNIALTTSQLTLFDLLKSLELGVSNSYLKRTVEQGGVEISGTKQTDLTKLLTLQGGEIVKFGKRTFRKISLQPSTIKD